MKKLILIATLTSACGIPLETTETGPTIRVYVDPANSSYVDSNEIGAEIRIDPDTNTYDFTVEINTMDGEIETMKGFDRVVVTAVEFSMIVDGVAIPDSPLESDMSIAAVTFTRRDPVSLPASAMGKAIVIHAVGTDGSGLHSNVVDWSVALR